MTTQRWRGPIVVMVTAVVMLVIGADLSLSRARRADGRRELHRQEMQVKRARRVTSRILNDRRASEAIKEQARELDQLFAERDRAIQRLETLHRDFITRHQTQIDELRAMRQRALEIDRRLSAGRKEVLAAHQAEVDALAEGAEQAEQLIDDLTTAYASHKRARRRAQGTAGG